MWLEDYAYRIAKGVFHDEIEEKLAMTDLYKVD